MAGAKANGNGAKFSEVVKNIETWVVTHRVYA
jgi:hypothetical protein